MNILTLTQRLTNGIEHIENRSVEIIDKFQKVLDEFQEAYPMEVSVNAKIDIVTKIVELQDSLKLKTNDLINGIVNGKVVRDPLLSQDIYEVGNLLNYFQDESKAIEWLKAALNVLEKEKFKDITEVKIYESLFIT